MSGPGRIRTVRVLILVIFIGLALSAILWLRTALQVDSCLDRGGHWMNGACEGASG